MKRILLPLLVLCSLLSACATADRTISRSPQFIDSDNTHYTPPSNYSGTGSDSQMFTPPPSVSSSSSSP